MAKFELKFLDIKDDCYIEAHELGGVVSIYMNDEDNIHNNGICIHLDKSTAIKFAKTLRTEINKIES